MMRNEEPQRNWFRFDSDRAISLDDVGGGDYRAVVALDPDDEECYALLSISAWQSKQPFPAVTVPGHEWRGRLPYEYRRRITAVVSGYPHHNGAPCCGRLTQSNNPCRNQVRSPGLPCFLHRNKALSD